MLVTGGSTDERSVEVLSAAGASLCTLPPLPTTRFEHTQNGLLSCGGSVTTNNCVKLSVEAGDWVVTHNLLEPREAHSSWESPAGLVLIGGLGSANTASILTHLVQTGSTTELLSSSDSSSSYSFTLQYDTE